MKPTHPMLKGVIPILATPFHDDESLDLKSLARMINFFAEAGVDGVTLLGVLGESNRLTDAERSILIRTAVQAAGKLPVIVGASHSGTAATIALTREAADLGATAVMVAPSKQPVPSDGLIFDYYARVGEQGGLPIVMQDHPASTEVHMSSILMLRIAREVQAVVCIKEEAVPSGPKIEAIQWSLKAHRDIPILTGLGALYGAFDLERKSDGFNTGFAFPEILMAMVRCAEAKDFDGAYAIYQRFLPLIVYEQLPGVAIRKEILRRRGLISSSRVRHPGGNLDWDERTGTPLQLTKLLERTFGDADLTKVIAL